MFIGIKSSNTSLIAQAAYEQSPVIDLREEDNDEEKKFSLDMLLKDDELPDKLSLVLQPTEPHEFSDEHDYKSADPSSQIPYSESTSWIGQ